MAGKADLVESIAANVEGLNKKQAAEAFDVVFDTLTDCLKKGDRVQLPGFGSFSVSHVAARKGRNPSTGAPIDIPASKKVKFQMGKELKATING